MVSRRSTQSVTQRSTRQSELHMTRRPRRLVAPKTVDDAVGLSRKEERELKKALYASLQESRRPRTPLPEEENSVNEEVPKLRKSTRNITPTVAYCAGGVKERNSVPVANMDESSQGSVMSSVASSLESKKKVHAQRKFAQGCSLPSTPSTTPSKKAANSPHSLLDRVPKTEDFLTFLCLRGSHLLPANLDFFNFARDESALEEDGSRQRTPVTAESGEQNGQTRESTPESSSSGSNVNEELLEITTPLLSTPSRLIQANRKAARASAGTPETARGIISLRQGLTRKVVHRSSTPPSQRSRKYLYTPEKTPSPSGSRLAFGNYTPAKKSATMKCLPASYLRFSPAGKLALDRNGNSPSLTPYKTPAVPSPLQRSKVKGDYSRGHGQGPRQKAPSTSSAFKPVEPVQTRRKKERESTATTHRSNSSPVRRILEGASKKLRKSQTANLLRTKNNQRLQKVEREKRDRSREVRAKKRLAMMAAAASPKKAAAKTDRKKTTGQEVKKSQRVVARPLQQQPKAKRRSSMRLKTQAKILGRKRPNYSLVLSGYSDMEEYEEEQKKRAAKHALARAKAEARARARNNKTPAPTTGRTAAKRKVKEPEKMRTRSASTATRDGENKGDKERGEERRSGDRTEERRTGDRERAEERRHGDRDRDRGEDRRGAGDRDKAEEKRSAGERERTEERRGAGERERTGSGPVKRTLSTSSSSSGKRDHTPLSSIVETKRLKRDGGSSNSSSGGGKETDGKDGVGTSGKQNGTRENGKKATPPSHTRKVTPKKSQLERPISASSSTSSSSFSSPDSTGLSYLEKVPTFYPSEEEFSDPVAYIESVAGKAEACGMCRIVPPVSWKMESKVNEEIRFITQVQHLHRLFNRWGASVEQTRAIVHHLRDFGGNQNSSSTPQIGGVEVDLPQLYRMIRDLGGLQNIVDKKQWVKVADAMKIPKTAHDRVTRLYDVYCKFVLPYAMLSEEEREQAQKDVHTQYELSSAEEEAVLKGKSMTLGTFGRIARNVQCMWFKDDPTPEMVEATYWKIVEDSKAHVSVQCAHVNTRTQSTAFPMRRESPYYRHSWNLNNLPDNKKCILKCLGPVSGTTIPTLHIGMLFSTSCWSTDPHRLPYVQYLHSGASTIWYCIPKNDANKFHEAMKELCPTLVHNQPIWLSEDTAMVKADQLRSKGVRVARCVQQPRQFVVVFPDAYTATVCCGYNISESVHYATTDWLSICMDAAKALCVSGDKEMFSVDTLVCGLCQDSADVETLSAALPLLQSIVAREIEERRQLSLAGLRCERRLAVEDSPGMSSSMARKRSHDLAVDSACEICYKICYLSMVLNEHDEQILCLEHGLRHVQRKRHIKAAKLFYRYTEEELTELVQTTKERLAALVAERGTNGTSGATKKRTLKKQDSRS